MILNLFISEILLRIQILLPSQLWILRNNWYYAGVLSKSFIYYGNKIGFRSQNVKVRVKISHNVWIKDTLKMF